VCAAVGRWGPERQAMVRAAPMLSNGRLCGERHAPPRGLSAEGRAR
jgi:hypothetical protein